MPVQCSIDGELTLTEGCKMSTLSNSGFLVKVLLFALLMQIHVLILTNQFNNQSIIPSTDMIQLTLTVKMTTAKVVETSVSVNNNSPIQDYVHPNNQTQPTFGFLFVDQLCEGKTSLVMVCMSISTDRTLPKQVVEKKYIEELCSLKIFQ